MSVTTPRHLMEETRVLDQVHRHRAVTLRLAQVSVLIIFFFLFEPPDLLPYGLSYELI